MLGTVINVFLILLGSAVGLLFQNRIGPRFTKTITQGLGLCVAMIGISSAMGTQDSLCMILCMVVGILIGEGIDIERRLDSMGELLRGKLRQKGEGSRFTEGFVTASLLYCVGSMAVIGALRAGIYHDYSTLLAKGVLDGITSISFAAAMGVGVAFSAVPTFLYQGGLTILFALLGPVLPDAMVTEMSAVGGAVIFALALNVLEVGREKIRVGNMLPAIFLPVVYLPLKELLTGLF